MNLVVWCTGSLPHNFVQGAQNRIKHHVSGWSHSDRRATQWAGILEDVFCLLTVKREALRKAIPFSGILRDDLTIACIVPDVDPGPNVLDGFFEAAFERVLQAWPTVRVPTSESAWHQLYCTGERVSFNHSRVWGTDNAPKADGAFTMLLHSFPQLRHDMIVRSRCRCQLILGGGFPRSVAPAVEGGSLICSFLSRFCLELFQHLCDIRERIGCCELPTS